MKVEIVSYSNKYSKYFYELNYDWLNEFFYVEEYDEQVLRNRKSEIIDKGGYIFFALNKKLAELMQSQNSYRLQIDEIHHTEKKDAPSGTGISLANDIISLQKNRTKWLNKASNDNEIVPIVSHRKHDVKGTHLVAYRSAIDDIEIKHTAHSREGFAKGAITAAEWLQGKQGFFGMNDMLAL